MNPQLPLIGDELAGYRLRAVLGRGGMSVVFEAENPRLSNTVALKVLAPEIATDDVFRARFLQESRVAASLNHPNVIPIYDMGAVDELLYIAMRHVAGADMRAMLRVQGRFEPAQALALVGQAGRALDAAHRRTLVHRDVKPANLLIERGIDDDPDHVYLADFGISKHELSLSGLTATGHFVGTLAYMAPEQIQGRHVDGRADIYSLGCVFYEALTGRVPFVKDVDAAVIWAHVEELPPVVSDISQLPKAIDSVIARVLAKDPEERYSTCREFIAAASAALVPEPGAPTRISAVDPEPPVTGPPTPAPQTVSPTSPVESTITPASEARAERPSTPRSSRSGLRARWAALLAAVLAIGIGAAVVLIAGLGGGAGPRPQQMGAKLGAVPDNRVTGDGSVTVTLRGDSATVTVAATGLLAGNPHLMHIHAGGQGLCPPASAARAYRGRRFISTGDGISYYGQTVASLTNWGSTSGVSPNNVAFNRYPAGGTIHYTRTFRVAPIVADLIRDDNAVVVIHGIDYNANHRYDFGALGVSDLDKTYPAEATAPALCGSLRPAAVGSTAHASASAAVIYTAPLRSAPVQLAQAISGSLTLLCHLDQIPLGDQPAPAPHARQPARSAV